MHPTRHCPTAATQNGVILLEALIAILMFSLGVLGIVGLQAGMVKNTSEAKYRSEASYIAQQEIGQMWADAANASSHLQNGTDISATTSLPGGNLTVTQANPGGAYLVTVGWQQPGEPAHSFSISFNLAGF